MLSSNLQKFNGKELQTVGSSSLRFLDYGARMYDPTTVRWLTQDPMAEKYYGYSPYNYCVGNPVNVIDTDGEEVRPAGSAELLMIQMTLPVEARNFVVLNKAGFIDGSVLAKCPNDSYNIYCLKQLVANEMILDVLLSDEYTWAPGNKKMKIDDHSNVNPYPMSYFGPDPEFMDPYNNIEDLSTGENGFMGKILFPDKDGLQNSPDQNIKIVINKNLSPQGRAESYSHEANGHGLLYIQSGHNHSAASYMYEGSTDLNKKLDNMILKSKIETITNNK